MKAFLNVKKFAEIICYLIFFLIFQIIIFEKMFGLFLPSYLILDFLLSLAFASVIFFFRKGYVDIIYLSVLTLVTTVLVIANGVFYENFGTIFSLYNLAIASQGMSVINNPDYFDFTFIAIIVSLYVLSVICLILINFFFRKSNYPKLSKSLALLPVMTLIVVYTFSFGLVNNCLNDFDGDTVISILRSHNYSEYGTYSYYLQEINYLLFGEKLSSDESMKSFFSQEKQQKNEFTGLLEGKNVFTIMIETGDDFMINEYLTPNMYQLTKDAIYCTNNYSKNKTNMTEFIGITGSAPSIGILPERYSYNLPYAATELLKDDYETYYFHDTSSLPGMDRDIYDREILMPKLGFEHCYFHEDLYGKDYPIWSWEGDYISDCETLPLVSDVLLKSEEPFYAFYTSLSMHGPYSDRKNAGELYQKYGEKLNYAKENNLWINPLDETSPINASCIDIYMMSAMDFDIALGNLFQSFEDAGKMDETLFILFGDHDIYYPGNDGECLNQLLANREDKLYSDIYTTTLFLKNPLLEETYLSKYGTNQYEIFSSPYDLLPTMLDLLNVDYNPTFYLGESLFNKSDEGIYSFYSDELSICFNEFYLSLDGETIYRTFKSGQDKEKFLSVTRKILSKQAHLDLIMTSNYFDNHEFENYWMVK